MLFVSLPWDLILTPQGTKTKGGKPQGSLQRQQQGMWQV